MKKYMVFFAVFFFLTGITAYAQSLGDFAREEQKRREAAPDGITIMLESARPAAPVEKVSAEDADADADETENPQEKDGNFGEDLDEKADPNELTDLYGNSESYWRNTMYDARSDLKLLEDEAKGLTSRLNAQQLQHNLANGVRRSRIKDEMDKTRQEQELNKKNLEEARSKLRSLQNEARSSGALPGWIE